MLIVRHNIKIIYHLFVYNFLSKHLLFFKTSWTRLEHVFSVTLFRLPRRLQDVFKMSWKRLANTSWKRLEEVLKTSSRCISKTSWTRLGRQKNCYAKNCLVSASANYAAGFSANGSSTPNRLFQIINGLLETVPWTITQFHLKIENLELFVNY